MSQATSLATSSLEPEDIMRYSVDAVVQFFDAVRADFWRMETGRLQHAVCAGAGPQRPPAPLFEFDRVTRARGHELVATDQMSSAAEAPWVELARSLGCDVIGIHTLSAQGRALGCLTILGTAATPPPRHELLIFAEQVGLALDKARLHEHAQQTARAMETQNRMLGELANCRELEAVLDLARRHLRGAADDAVVALSVYDDRGRALVVSSKHGAGPEARRLTNAAEHDCIERFASADTPLVRRVAYDLQPGEADALRALGMFAGEPVPVIGVPLVAHNKRLGVMLASTPIDEQRAALEESLQHAAPALAIGVENALLFTRANLRSDRLAASNDLAHQLSSITSFAELHVRLATGLQTTMGYPRVAVYDENLVLHVERGIRSQSFREEQALVATAADRRRLSRHEQERRTCWSVPLSSRGRLFAVLYVEHPEVASFDESDRALLEGIAEQAAGTLTAIAAYEDLEKNYVATVQALASALEASDQYTHDHAQDVAEWAVEVARRLGLEGQEIKDIELGALFHDIGKIAIPSEILNKPGKLTDDEFEVMKTHTVVGEQIIAPIEFLERVRPIVRHEHERWDGRGYPDGLAGEDIPLGSRIIFVCDAYHAITSDRPYREAQSHDIARRVLIENAGTQFDSAVVSVFLEVIEEQREAQGVVNGPPELLDDDAQLAA